MRVVLALTIVLFAGAVQAQGLALAWCEEERAAELVGPAQAAAAPLAILPCALVDSGRVGGLDDAGAPTACADSPFYVVTHAGVLLCQIDVELFVAGSDEALERAPSALPLGSSATHAALLTSGVRPLPPPAPGVLVPSPGDAQLGRALDAVTWRPPRPS